MYIVMIASECAPVAKVGGLGDVVFGLTRELEIRGHSVEIILPKYDCMRYDRIWGLTRCFSDLWVPFYNQWALTHQLLYDIYNQCRDVDDVVVVNNGSTETHGLSWWQDAKLLPLRVVSLVPNKGFLMGANEGVQSALGDIVALVSNDVRIKGNITGFLRATYSLHDHVVMGGRLLSGDTGWNNFDGRIFPYLEGWFLAAPAEVWKELNYFDRRFAPNDFEDVDFSTTAIEAGYKLQALPEGSVEHMGAQTISYGPEREALTKVNQRKFKAKWIK